MRRRLVTFLTALSLLLCGAGAVAWARSYVASDVITATTGGRQTDLFSEAGSYVFRRALIPEDYGYSWAWMVEEPVIEGESILRALIHFEWTTHPEVAALYIVLPQWTAPAAFGVLPAVRFIRWRRRRRSAALRGFPLAREGESV